MKKNIQFCFLLLMSLPGFAQLKWLNPTPSGYINTKISFVNDSSGYLMNYNGDLFISRDTGSNWQLLKNFPNARQFKINDSTGMIPAGDGFLYISTDNGNTWRKDAMAGIRSEWCDIVGRDTLFILKSTTSFYITSLYKSVNRGVSWQLVNNNLNQYNLSNIDFISSRVGYASRADGIYKTTDGGVSWQTVYSITSSANVTCVKFFTADIGFAYRQGNGMLKTIDGGATWTVSSTVADDISDIFWVNSNNAYAVGEHGVIYKTTDGGLSWIWASPSARIYAYGLYSQYFFNNNTGIVTGHRGRLLKTKDGGNTWANHSPTYIDVTSIAFGNNATGYATTWNNVFKTTDAGITWRQLPLEVGTTFANYSRFEHSRFWDKDSGIITASLPARLYKTTDGGNNWTIINPAGSSYDNITDMSFINRDTGFIQLTTGSAYGLFKTTNAGNSWQEIGSYQNFNKLQFLNSRFGYATRYNKVYRTSDGGVSWTEMNNDPSFSALKGMWFVNPAKGFIIYDQGYLKMTADSGRTWNQINISQQTLPDYTSIKFFNEKIGYLTDDEGWYYTTTDGGTKWKQSGSTGFNECKVIYFKKDSTVILSGIYGTIASIDLAQYSIDSLTATTAACSASLQAKVTTIFSKADSIYFEYGKGSFTNKIAAAPVAAVDTALIVRATINNLIADSTYKLRVKILYRGAYYYSAENTFVPTKLPPPVITAAGNTLTSSYNSGNQWYLDKILLPGATAKDYTASVTGKYSVIATQNGCPSIESSDYDLTTIINSTGGLAGEITVFPNPAAKDDDITIKVESRNRTLQLTITDLFGKVVATKPLVRGSNIIPVKHMIKGLFILSVTDVNTNESTKRKLLKL